MDLTRLLRPRSVAVVGASERDDSYAGETLLNLRLAGFAGPVWGVNPKRAEAHGFPCFPSLSELPEVPDAVVVGIPAAGCVLRWWRRQARLAAAAPSCTARASARSRWAPSTSGG